MRWWQGSLDDPVVLFEELKEQRREIRTVE
jgi:hypothetical protein